MAPKNPGTFFTATSVEVNLSFRDPGGFVFRAEGRILRCVFPNAAGNLRAFLSSPLAGEWISEGVLTSANLLALHETVTLPPTVQANVREGAVLLEHRPIWFPNFPYEWSPEMLRAAALATLRLARESLREGFALKDATPYNIMFEGARPIFIDVLSFEPRDALELIWCPYAQFVRTFVYPLMAARYSGARLDELLLVNRDGLEPERIARLLGWRRWLPPFLGAVTAPALLSGRSAGVPARRARDAREAEFVLERGLKVAARMLPEIPRADGKSDYLKTDCIYSPAEFSLKEKTVAAALERFRPRSVLDAGSNTGHFSTLAARAGATVVAIDRDPAIVDAVWRSASRDQLPILPLVIDIARPPGACGWANSESPAFLERARDRFDAVLMLALAHHLIVNERVPLDRIFDLAASLTRSLLLIEYIDPADPQFRAIARGRDALHRDLTAAAFESAARARFAIADCQAITATRRIYTLQRKNG
jgi:SAM-dependent methyltransferase